MAPDNGRYLLLYTKSLRSPLFQDAGLWHLWSYLLMLTKMQERAPGRERKVLWRGKERKLERGQVTVNYRDLATVLGTSRSGIQRKMKVLSSCRAVRTEMATRFTLVTICNWDSYQPAWDARGTDLGRKWDASGTSLEKEIQGERETTTKKEPPVAADFPSKATERINPDPEPYPPVPVAHRRATGLSAGPTWSALTKAYADLVGSRYVSTPVRGQGGSTQTEYQHWEAWYQDAVPGFLADGSSLDEIQAELRDFWTWYIRNHKGKGNPRISGWIHAFEHYRPQWAKEGR